MMWITNPKARTGTITVTNGVAMISHAVSNASSLNKNVELATRWTVRNSIKNKPLMLIISFLPIDDVKMFAIDINCIFVYKPVFVLQI